MKRILLMVLFVAACPLVSVANAQAPPMLLHDFVTRPLGDNEKKVLVISNGCMAMAEAPDDDWDRFMDLIEHNKNEYADDLGFQLMECHRMPDRVAMIENAFLSTLESDPRHFITTIAGHTMRPGQLPILLATVKPKDEARRKEILQKRLDRALSIQDPELRPARDRIVNELSVLLGVPSPVVSVVPAPVPIDQPTVLPQAPVPQSLN